MVPLPMCDSAESPCFHGCPAFLHRYFPPQSPPLPPLNPFSAVNSSSHPGIVPQSLKSSSQLLCLPGDLCPCLGYVWLWQGLSDSHSISLKCSSSDSDNCPSEGIRPLLQFLYPPRAGPVLLKLLFFSLVPSSYRILRGSTYSFLVVRYSCPLSAGILHALLCLKMYS